MTAANVPPNRGTSRLFVYYFGFPHYRRNILRELCSRSDVTVSLVSGRSTKGDIATLNETDIPELVTRPTFRVGPFSWDRGVAWAVVSEREGAVVLGPATTSITTWVIIVMRSLLRRRTYLWGQCGRPGDRSVKRRVQEVMNRLATGLLVYGELEKSAAGELGTDPQKIHVVHNATDYNGESVSQRDDELIFRRIQERAAAVLERGELILVYVGRVVKFKRVDVLLDAAAKLKERYPNTRVEVVGGGSELESLSRRYVQDMYRFRGWMYGSAERDAVLQSATLVVSPEHLGLLAVDALRAGVPVLVPDNPMNASEVESLTLGVNALNFSRNDDSDAIVDAVDRWLAGVHAITADQYLEARRRALVIWSPESVAASIVNATRESPARESNQ